MAQGTNTAASGKSHWQAGALIRVAVVFAVLSAATAATLHSPERFAAPDVATRQEGMRYLRDDFDRNVYWQRGEFVEGWSRPYVDVPSEYPQGATYFFGALRLIGSSWSSFRTLFSIAMAVLLAAMAVHLRELGRPYWWALVLPGSLYFSLLRFDLLVVALVLGSHWAFTRRRWTIAGGLLALGVLTKSYPLLYVPAYLLWAGPNRWRWLIGFVAVAGAMTLQLGMWVGFEATLSPWVLQATREVTQESVLGLVANWTGIATDGGALRGAFLGGQILGLFWLRRSQRGKIAQVRWLAGTTLCLVVFAPFNSPQWLLWFSPLCAFAARSRAELGLLVAADILTYAHFPLLYDLFGVGHPALNAAVSLGACTRLALAYSMLRARYDM